jgi:hypothetical protein
MDDDDFDAAPSGWPHLILGMIIGGIVASIAWMVVS